MEFKRLFNSVRRLFWRTPGALMRGMRATPINEAGQKALIKFSQQDFSKNKQ
jgi:hypothetical protein